MSNDKLFLFPGQGSHFLGMGKEFLESNNEIFKDLITIASDTLKEDLMSYVMAEKSEGFNRSAILQPLIVAISLSYLDILEQKGITPTAVMGHSLGEISALASLGLFSKEFAVEMAAVRGQLMDKSVEKCCSSGGMAAVLFVSENEIYQAIKDYNLDDELFIANINAPTQIAISGKKNAIAQFKEKFTKEHRTSVQLLDVNGPWHTKFIQYAHDEFTTWVQEKTFNSIDGKMVLNSTAKLLEPTDNIKEILADKFISPVLWADSMRVASEKFKGYNVYEIGPSKILTGLLRANKVKKSFGKIYNINSYDSLDAL